MYQHFLQLVIFGSLKKRVVQKKELIFKLKFEIHISLYHYSKIF